MCRMAKVDLARRAQIGQEKRARTRAALVAAAKSLFVLRSIESVTIDEIVTEAGLAKGTFYTHFESLDALTAAVADELVAAFDDLMQPARLAIADPLDRIAFGCNAFIEKALEDPGWAQVVTRMARFRPAVGEGTRSRLLEDLRRALKNAAGPAPSPDLAPGDRGRPHVAGAFSLRGEAGFPRRPRAHARGALEGAGRRRPADPVDLGALAKAGVDVESGPAGAATAGRPRDRERPERPRPPVRGLARTSHPFTRGSRCFAVRRRSFCPSSQFS